MLVCRRCWEVSNIQVALVNDDLWCESCCTDFIELDELIAPTIRLLNQKGYTTISSGAGNWLGTSNLEKTYVEFQLPCEIELVAPKGFKWEHGIVDSRSTHTMVCYHSFCHHVPLEQRIRAILETNIRLYEWAHELPPRVNSDEEWLYMLHVSGERILG